MSKIIELRQDRSLISSNFDGYKLSLDPVPIIRQELDIIPNKAEPNEDQYSLLHAELFSMPNLLESDPWSRTNAYFINRKDEIMRCEYDENIGRPNPLTVVYRLTNNTCIDSATRIKGDYNYSIRFVSEKYCVLCDGIRQLYLLETDDRRKGHEWKLLAKTSITDINEGQRNFTIYDCRLDTIQEQKQITLALGHIERVVSADGGSSHYNQIYCAQWIYNDAWIFSILDILEGNGSLFYCAFEPRATSLIISSNRDYKFQSTKSGEKAELHQQQRSEEVHAAYSWTQTNEDIVIKFNENDSNSIKDYNIQCALDELKVELQSLPLLDITLFDKVDKDLTTWTIENNFLQITLIKKTPELCWPHLLRNGDGPAESMDDAYIPIPLEKQPIANLEAPIEDCDFPIGSLDEDVKIVRFHLATKEVKQTVILGAHPPLFSTNLRAGFPNAIATRVDVDASLWIMQYSPLKPDDWNLRHEGNLHAFGYVQASKQQKKFTNCAPDLSYGIICESHKHIFLYKAKHDTANGLRNRNGPQVTIGKQHLITLKDSEEVLGMTTATNVVIILTEKSVLYLQIN